SSWAKQIWRSSPTAPRASTRTTAPAATRGIASGSRGDRAAGRRRRQRPACAPPPRGAIAAGPVAHPPPPFRASHRKTPPPAALCGVAGLKPTYGLVSRHGVVPLSWSQDHVGPLARTVRDAALLLQAIAGHDPRDPASSRAPLPDYLATLEDGAAGLRLAVP